MADNSEEVTVTLINDKVQFTGVSPANPDRPTPLTTNRRSVTDRGMAGLNCCS